MKESDVFKLELGTNRKNEPVLQVKTFDGCRINLFDGNRKFNENVCKSDCEVYQFKKFKKTLDADLDVCLPLSKFKKWFLSMEQKIVIITVFNMPS